MPATLQKKNPIIKNYLKRRKLTRWPRSVGSGERYPWSLRWWRARDCNWTIVKKVNKQKWSFRAISLSTQKKNFRREMIDTDGWTQMESMQKPFVGARWARNECFFLLKEASEISGSEEQLNSRVVRYRFLPIFHRSYVKAQYINSNFRTRRSRSSSRDDCCFDSVAPTIGEILISYSPGGFFYPRFIAIT